ncbi:MAG: Gfo/Idh/MocA family oxidoreductase [Capsulimonadales bacterium]|nr:Gfo/Idh/MocA family oxidoreductase [Capsulimonadales bacterium]
MKDDSLSFGLSGCGWFGGVHVDRLSRIPNVRIAAVTDPDVDAAKRLAEKVPAAARPEDGVAVYTDYADMLRHPGLDAVSINSPNRWHVEQLIAALSAGRHVLCEKPLTLIPAEATAAIEATRLSGKIVAISYQSRYRREARLLRHAVRSGRFGKVTSLSAVAGEDWVTPNLGTWRHDPERCPGGYFGDANSHQLDLLLRITGLSPVPGTVRATMEHRGTPVPIVIYGEAKLSGERSGETASEVPFVFSFVGDSHRWRQELTIITEGADFVLRDGDLLWSDAQSKPLAPFTEADAGLTHALTTETPDDAFVAALRGGPPVDSAPETVLPVLNLTLAALAAAGEPLPR